MSGWPTAGHRHPDTGAASGPMGNQEQSGSSTELCRDTWGQKEMAVVVRGHFSPRSN